MALMRWEPFRDLEELQDSVNRLFNNKSFRSRRSDEELSSRMWTPVVDVYETENEITIKAEIPGVSKKDINIEVKDGILTLSGERKREKDVKEENYHRIERYYGSFQRSFSLPSHVDQDKVKAKFKDGILEITLPKADTAKPKKIEIGID